MKKYLKDFAAVVATVCLSAFGLQACSEDVEGILAALGVDFDAPATMDILSAAWDQCESCDGEVSSVNPGGKGLDGGDDDYDALMAVIRYLAYYYEDDNGAIRDEFNMEQDDFFENLFGEEGIPPGVSVPFGPMAGLIDLDDTCGEGTGTLVVTMARTFEGYPAKGEKPYGNEIREYERYNLVLSNCEIQGDLLDVLPKGEPPSNASVTLSGTVSVTEIEDDDDTVFTLDVVGSLIINPGLVETSGEGPTPVWGYNTPLVINASAVEDNSGGFDEYEGGACYGGLSAASEEACGDGIFVSGNTVMPFWANW